MRDETAGRRASLFHRTGSFRFLAPEGIMSIVSARFVGSGIGVARVTSTGHQIAVEEPERLTILLPRSGRLLSAVGEAEHEVEPGRALGFGPNRRRTRVVAPTTGAYVADVITIAESRIASLGREADLPTRGLSLGPRLPNLSGLGGAVVRCLDLVRPEAPSPPAPGRALLAEADLLNHLAALLVWAGREGPAARSAGRQRVAAAVALMRERLDEPLVMTEVAREVGTSLRSLQLAFREVGRPRPHEVLTELRLEAARAMLLARGRSVTEAALECGFTHLGRFPAQYRAHFGELPSQTLRRAAS